MQCSWHTTLCIHRSGHSLLCSDKSFSAEVEGVCSSSAFSEKRDAAGPFLIMWVVFTVQSGSSEMCRLRNLKFVTCSTSSPLMLKPEYSVVLDLQKSMMISFVFLVLRLRWLSLHQASSAWTSSLYGTSSTLLISPTMVVSSTNFIRVLEPLVATQSWVYSVYKTGLRTQP